MNELSARITNIESNDSISLIELKNENQLFKTVVINSGNKEPEYIINEDVILLFKETEVILGKGEFENISLQNRISCKISSIVKGKLLSKIYLDSEVGKFCSIIT